MSTAHRTAALLLGCVVWTAAGRAGAQDWPQWRGANRDAKAAGFVAPATWPKALTQKWKLAIGDGTATPALVGDKLYVVSRQGGDEITRCLDAATGNEIWQDKFATDGAKDPGGYVGPRSSPAVADGKVVTLSATGTLSCLDAATGKKLWRKDDFRGSTPRFFVASSPMILDGLVIAQLGGNNNGVLAAYDLGSGEQKWKWSGDSPAYASPVMMTVGGTKLIIAMTEAKLVAVNAADGKQVWETPFASMGPRGYNASTPLVDGQTLIYSGGSRGTKAVKFEKTGDAITAKELWSNPDKSVQFNSPIIKDGFIYGLSATNELFCLNAQTGEAVAWNAPPLAGGGGGGGPGGGGPGGGGPGGGRPGGGGPPGGGAGGGRGGGGGMGGGRGGGGSGYGTIVDAGSVLLALTPSQQLIVFQPGAKYTELAKIKIADTPTHAYPVVSGNRFFIKDKDSLTLLTLE